jgi:hypothetical protein
MAAQQLLVAVDDEVGGMDVPVLGESNSDVMCAMVLRAMKTMEKRVSESIKVRLIDRTQAVRAGT